MIVDLKKDLHDLLIEQEELIRDKEWVYVVQAQAVIDYLCKKIEML